MPLDGAVVLPLALFLAGWGALAFSAWRLAARSPFGGSRRALHAAALFCCFLSWIPTVWGFLGVFHPFAYGMTAMVLAGACLLLPADGRAGTPRAGSAEDRRAESRDGRGPSQGLVVLALLIGAILHGGLVLRALVLPPFGGDTRLYHLPKVIGPLQDGSWSCRRVPAWYYPAGAEAVQLWPVALFGDDFLVNLVGVPALVFFLGSLAAIARRRAGGEGALLAVLLALAAPVMHAQVGVGKNDVTWAAWLLYAHLQLVDRRAGPFLLAVAMAASVKYAALPYVLVLVVLAWRRFPPGRLLRGLPWAWPLLPWYLRNLFLTGNPVFPFGLPGAGADAYGGTSLLAAWGRALATGRGAGLAETAAESLRLTLAAGGWALAVLPAVLVLARGDGRRGRCRPPFGAMGLCLLLFLVTPFSGRALPGDPLMGGDGSSWRLGLPFMALAWATVAGEGRARGVLALLAAASALPATLALLGWLGENLGWVLPAAAGAGLLALLVTGGLVFRGRRAPVAMVAALLVVALGAARLHALRRSIRPLVMERMVGGRSGPSRAPTAFEALDPTGRARVEAAGLPTLDWTGPRFGRPVGDHGDLDDEGDAWLARLEREGVRWLVLRPVPDQAPPRLRRVLAGRLATVLASPRHPCRFTDGRIWIFRVPDLARR